MMSLTFGLFTQVSDLGPHGPLIGIVLATKTSSHSRSPFDWVRYLVSL